MSQDLIIAFAHRPLISGHEQRWAKMSQFKNTFLRFYKSKDAEKLQKNTMNASKSEVNHGSSTVRVVKPHLWTKSKRQKPLCHFTPNFYHSLDFFTSKVNESEGPNVLKDELNKSTESKSAPTSTVHLWFAGLPWCWLQWANSDTPKPPQPESQTKRRWARVQVTSKMFTSKISFNLLSVFISFKTYTGLVLSDLFWLLSPSQAVCLHRFHVS